METACLWVKPAEANSSGTQRGPVLRTLLEPPGPAIPEARPLWDFLNTFSLSLGPFCTRLCGSHTQEF